MTRAPGSDGAEPPLWFPLGGASAYVARGAAPHIEGDRSTAFAWASVTKLVTAYACLIAVEEGVAALTDAADGFSDLTLAHLLAHAGGLAFDQPDRIAPPATERLYSNAGLRLAAKIVETHTEMPFADYVATGILLPLRMDGLQWGDPATGAVGTIADLAAFAFELLSPTLIAPETLREAVRPWWPLLDGFVPGFGMQRPCPWGLGFEIKGTKRPHWTGATNSAETFGHFGQSGAMLAVDPQRSEAWCSLSPEPFGAWAKRAWPQMIDGTTDQTNRSEQPARPTCEHTD